MKAHKACLLNISILTLFPALALAAEGHEHHATVLDLIFPIINFTLFCLLMYFLLRRSVRTGLIARRDNFQQALDRSKKLNADAQGKLDEVERQQRNLENMLAELRKTIAEESVKESEQIVLEAEKRAHRLLEKAAETAQSEVKALQDSLKKELVDMVMRLAEDKIKQELDREADAKLRQGAVQTVLNNKFLQ